ncbi:structure-specific endonuclease subunit SLX1 homolog [Culicoides brevitarsis]|uniref:structure-specific endonuclease subunit SLX1 homolog n=1 Tax=Culicoides brevitarsis TaxID=469753 RepID=UPI00307CAB93
MSLVQEDFFGVYCLVSKSENPRYKNRCYIGFTVNPNRRETQHNRGKDFGGAKKTSNRGPWVMVMIIHGFPNKIAALRFEWAWQKPGQSRILRHIPGIDKKRPKESHFEHHLRILSEMLRVCPFTRLPLTIQWLSDDHHTEFPAERVPPLHMAIRFGRITCKRKAQNVDQDILSSQGTVQFCDICDNVIEKPLEEMITCLNSSCKLVSHVICLAEVFLKAGNENKGQVIPVQGSCPVCEKDFLWGDLIRKKKGCCDIEPDLNNTDVFEVRELSDDENDDECDDNPEMD